MVKRSLWRISRIRCGLDLLGLHIFLFPRALDGERCDDGLRWRQRRRRSCQQSLVPAYRIGFLSGPRSDPEYRRPRRWQVAAKCRRHWNLRAYDHADWAGRVLLACARSGDAFHAARHDARVELGHGKFLATDRVCVHGTRACGHDERGSSRARGGRFRARFSVQAFRSRLSILRGRSPCSPCRLPESSIRKAARLERWLRVRHCSALDSLE